MIYTVVSLLSILSVGWPEYRVGHHHCCIEGSTRLGPYRAMAVWKYSALSQDDNSLPETVQQSSSAGGGSNSFAISEDDIALKKRMPFCIGL